MVGEENKSQYGAPKSGVHQGLDLSRSRQGTFTTALSTCITPSFPLILFIIRFDHFNPILETIEVMFRLNPVHPQEATRTRMTSSTLQPLKEGYLAIPISWVS